MDLLYFIIFFICLWLLISMTEVKIDDFNVTLNTSEKNYRAFQLYLLNSSNKEAVPKFKFYSSIVEELLKLKKHYGTDISTATRELRKSSQQDYKEEKLITNELIGYYFQYLFISIFTWVFSINFQQTLEIQSAYSASIALLLFQLTGLIISWRILSFVKKSTFTIYSSYFNSLYVLKSLLLASRPLSQALESAQFIDLKRSSKLVFIQNTIEKIMKNIKELGEFHQDDIEGVLQDLWSLYENEIQQFKKKLMAIKLFFICFFIFPGFLWNLYRSLEQVMIWS